MSLNRVTIAGRICQDLELKRTQSGLAVTNFTLAVDDDFKDKQTGERKTQFIEVVAWRQTAEFVCQYFSKGRAAIVDGKLQTRAWEDKDGNKRKSVEVVAESIYFANSKKEERSDSYEPENAEYNRPALEPFGEDELEGDLPF